MALVIHVGSHPDELVGQLCEMLASPPADPFAREVVAVPTRGIERWLTQRISSELANRTPGDGVCANVEFPSPRRLVREVLLAVPELAASLDAWEGTALTRCVVSVVDDHLAEPWMWLLARFVDAPNAVATLGNSQRLRAARKIGGLFARYARRRPEMVRAWTEGEDLGPGGETLPGADIWQPRLWRLVRARIGAPSPAELLPEALTRSGPARSIRACRSGSSYTGSPRPTRWIWRCSKRWPPAAMSTSTCCIRPPPYGGTRHSSRIGIG